MPGGNVCESRLRHEKIDDASIERNYGESLPAIRGAMGGFKSAQSASNVLVRGTLGMLVRNLTSSTLARSASLFCGIKFQIAESEQGGPSDLVPESSARPDRFFALGPAGFPRGNFPLRHANDLP